MIRYNRNKNNIHTYMLYAMLNKPPYIGTLGFCRCTSQTLRRPKELNFTNARK